jgi:hypothetical protein
LSAIVLRRIEEKKRECFECVLDQAEESVKLTIIPGMARWNFGIRSVFPGKIDIELLDIFTSLSFENYDRKDNRRFCPIPEVFRIPCCHFCPNFRIISRDKCIF